MDNRNIYFELKKSEFFFRMFWITQQKKMKRSGVVEEEGLCEQKKCDKISEYHIGVKLFLQ